MSVGMGYAVQAEGSYDASSDERQMKSPKKKVGWLKRKFAQWSRDAWESESLRMQENILKERASNRIQQISLGSSNLNVTPMRFSLYKANGGFIVETQFLKGDRNQLRTSDEERNSYKLHIITDEKDLGSELAKIITFENLRA